MVKKYFHPMALFFHKWLFWSVNYPLRGLEFEIMQKNLQLKGILEGKLSKLDFCCCYFKFTLKITPPWFGYDFDKEENYAPNVFFSAFQDL